jgi:putative hydrolase of HD superfamily
VNDLERRLQFVLELDALKRVERRNPIGDGSRRENTAEHSWHLAVMALVLAPHANEPVDPTRVVAMLLLHDVVEIDAGDTFIYDDAGQADKEAREQAAADRLYGLLPPAQATQFRAIWDEYEANETADARFAHAIDRLSPLMLNHATEGASWREHDLTDARVRGKNATIADGSHELWQYAQTLIDEGVAEGWLRPH